MEFPRLSVVLPNFNHARFLPRCLKALLEQSTPPFEVIVIDDASTDHSLDVLHEFAGKNPGIRIYRNESNQGVVFGMNRGLDLARGDYVFFPAADDQVLPGLFEKSLRLLTEHPQAALSCTISEWRHVSSGLAWHMGAGLADRPCYLSPAELVGLGKKGKLFIVSHSAIFKRQALNAAGRFFPDLRWHCDWYACFVLAFRHGLCYVPEPLSTVSLHPDSFYGKGRRNEEHLQVLTRLLDQLSATSCADVAPPMRESAVLSQFGWPILRLLIRRREYRRFLTPLFILRAFLRSGELLGKQILPRPLARLCLRLLYHHKQTPDHGGANSN